MRYSSPASARPARLRTMAATAALVLAFGMAGAHAYSVNNHAARQQARINRGVQTGALTPQESSGLQRRQQSITTNARQDRAANGGTLTPKDKVELGARQADLSASIAAQKHDAQTAPPQ